MKIKTFKNYFLVFYFIFLIIFSFTIDSTSCSDNLELLEPKNLGNESELHDSDGVLNNEKQTNNTYKETSSSDKYDKEPAQAINSGKENTTIDADKYNVNPNSAEFNLNNKTQTNNKYLKSQDGTKLEEDNSNVDNVADIKDNNEDSEEIYRDDRVIEDENEEIFKDIESVVDKHEDNLSTYTTDSDWEKNILDFDPAEMLTLELQSEKEVNYIKNYFSI